MMKKFLQLLLGILFVCSLVWVFNRTDDKIGEFKVPEGFLIIRPPYEVSTLAEYGEYIWAGGRDGIDILERKSGRQQAVPAALQDIRYVNEIIKDKDGQLWIAHNGGLIEYSPATSAMHRWTESEGVPPGAALTVYQDAKGMIWAGYEQGLVCYDGTKWQSIKPPDGFVAAGVTVIFADSKGNLWFGSLSSTHGGLVMYDGQKWQSYTENLPHKAVNAIAEDSEGLWVGTGFANEGGAAHFVNGNWQFIKKQDGLAGEKVRSIFADENGSIFFGSEYDGLTIRNGRGWQHYMPAQGLAGKEIKKIIKDKDGVFWLATEDGISRIEKWH